MLRSAPTHEARRELDHPWSSRWKRSPTTADIAPVPRRPSPTRDWPSSRRATKVGMTRPQTRQEVRPPQRTGLVSGLPASSACTSRRATPVFPGGKAQGEACPVEDRSRRERLDASCVSATKLQCPTRAAAQPEKPGVARQRRRRQGELRLQEVSSDRRPQEGLPSKRACRPDRPREVNQGVGAFRPATLERTAPLGRHQQMPSQA